jgi:hypothetical protein
VIGIRGPKKREEKSEMRKQVLEMKSKIQSEKIALFKKSDNYNQVSLITETADYCGIKLDYETAKFLVLKSMENSITPMAA